ncbi:FxsA family protein [Actinomadura viridis]|uniref:FxsA family protein n=1 Tax=Actinomadura viridis TaxID=58110 RepID=UPI00368172C7
MPALVLFFALLLTPVLEIFVIVQVAGAIGGWWTLALILGTSALGAWITRREGRRAWRVLNEAVREGTVPDRELSGSAMVLLGGLLMLAPGFVSDAVGLLFVLPFTRPVVRRLLAAFAARRLRKAEARGSLFPPGGQRMGGFGGGPFDPYGTGGRGAASGPGGRVVQGEVVHDAEGRREEPESGQASGGDRSIPQGRQGK